MSIQSLAYLKAVAMQSKSPANRGSSPGWMDNARAQPASRPKIRVRSSLPTHIEKRPCQMEHCFACACGAELTLSHNQAQPIITRNNEIRLRNKDLPPRKQLPLERPVCVACAQAKSVQVA